MLAPPFRSITIRISSSSPWIFFISFFFFFFSIRFHLFYRVFSELFKILLITQFPLALKIEDMSILFRWAIFICGQYVHTGKYLYLKILISYSVHFTFSIKPRSLISFYKKAYFWLIITCISYIMGEGFIETPFTITLFARPFRRRFFAYHYAGNHPHTNIILSWFSIPLVLKCAAKILKIGLQIKIKHLKMFLNRDFA